MESADSNLLLGRFCLNTTNFISLSVNSEFISELVNSLNHGLDSSKKDIMKCLSYPLKLLISEPLA